MLIKMFKETGAFKLAPPDEPFTLASGKKSDYYIDCRKVILSPYGNQLITQAMSELIIYYMKEQNRAVSTICVGTTGVGGAPLLGSIIFSMWPVMSNGGFVIRDVPKDHGLKRLVEGHVEKDATIILIDDVLTTGGSIKNAAATLWEAHQVRPDAVMVLVDREEGGEAELRSNLGCDVRSFLKVSDFRVDQPVTVI
jgi:orotate phosphoribosyltransferase